MDRVRTFAMTGVSNADGRDAADTPDQFDLSVHGANGGARQHEIRRAFHLLWRQRPGCGVLLDAAGPYDGGYLGSAATRRAMRPSGVTFAVRRMTGKSSTTPTVRRTYCSRSTP